MHALFDAPYSQAEHDASTFFCGNCTSPDPCPFYQQGTCEYGAFCPHDHNGHVREYTHGDGYREYSVDSEKSYVLPRDADTNWMNFDLLEGLVNRGCELWADTLEFPQMISKFDGNITIDGRLRDGKSCKAC